MKIDDKWLPTRDNINALPERLRDYVQGLETLCDPAGLVRENTQLKDLNAGLQAMYRNASDARKPYTEWPLKMLNEHRRAILQETVARMGKKKPRPKVEPDKPAPFGSVF